MHFKAIFLLVLCVEVYAQLHEGSFPDPHFRNDLIHSSHGRIIYPVSNIRATATTTTTIRPTTTTTTTKTIRWPTPTKKRTRRPTATITTKKPTESQISFGVSYVLKHSPFSCNGLKDGHYADTYYDCMYFHQCEFILKADNLIYVQEAVFLCGEGTKFNQTLRICDDSLRVSCDKIEVDGIIREQLNAPKSPPRPRNTLPTPITRFRCIPGLQSDGFYYADEESNCKYYHSISPTFKHCKMRSEENEQDTLIGKF
ncbi:hypothetical protein GQR58_013756 [Nymphon striatum]|nr:hypothetical protein GQR58_013756 [Nymphon striatum]